MKPTLAIILTAALVAVIFMHQQKSLTALKDETRQLEQRPTASSSVNRRRGSVEQQKDATPAQVELVRDTMVEAFLAFQNRNGVRDPEKVERTKQLFLAAKDLSARNMETVMSALTSDPRLAGVKPDELIQACGEIFGGSAPFSWREYLVAHRNLPEWQRLFDEASRQCMREDSNRALALIERETAQGNPEVATTGIHSIVLMELAASNPDKMLARAISPEYTADPDALAHLGGFVASRLKKPVDHQSFLAALRRAQEKNPSPVLAKIREEYIGGMTQKFYAWPADQAIALIDSEFTSAERFQAAEQCASRMDLSDPEKWIDWFLKVNMAEWSAWSAQQGNRVKHPLVRQIESRAIRDADEPAKWLGKIPAGALHDEATLSYAWMIAERAPDRAASYLDQLPASKGKKNLVERIDEARQ